MTIDHESSIDLTSIARLDSSVGRGGRAQKNLADRFITTSFPLLDGRGQSALQRPTGRPRLFDAAADSDVLAMSLRDRRAWPIGEALLPWRAPIDPQAGLAVGSEVGTARWCWCG